MSTSVVDVQLDYVRASDTYVIMLARRLRRLRRAAEISARALDALARLAPGHTALIESGRRVAPSTATASALSAVLGVSLDWLIAGRGEPPSDDVIRASVDAARKRSAA